MVTITGVKAAFARLGMGFFALIILSISVPTSLEAKSRTCLRLERQLASLNRGGRSTNPFKVLKYNGAIKRQKDQIRQAKRRIKRAGCSSGSKKRSSSCRRLKRSLGKMNTNLKQLRAKRNRYSSKGGSSKNQKRKIRRAIAANRCNEPRPVIASNRSGVLFEPRVRRRTIIEHVFGDEREFRRRRYRRDDGYYNEEEDYYPNSGRGRFGTYRTLCVRTCDGYYFPISFSTTSDNFDRDTQSCSAKCPGTETELYFHATRSETADDMISYGDNQPYKSLENAFKYREVVTKGCGCKFSQGQFAAIAGEGGAYSADEDPQTRKPLIGTPSFRIDRGEDPETLANLKGDFVPVPVSPNKPADTVAAKNTRRKVRVVGEAFFPSQ